MLVDDNREGRAVETAVPTHDVVPTARDVVRTTGWLIEPVPVGGTLRRPSVPATVVRWGRRSAGVLVLVLSVAAAVAARAQAPWIPVAYLVAVLASGAATWYLARWRSGPRTVRRPALGVAAAMLIGLCPVPWLEANLTDPPGTAWRLDGRLTIEGQVTDPDGSWYWLTAGRPPLVVEMVRSWLFEDTPAGTSLRNGRVSRSPRFNEPAAAAVGLRHAGRQIESSVVVEASRPTQAGLPEHTVIAQLNGIDLSTQHAWDAALATLSPSNVLTTDDGVAHRFAGAALPYRHVEVLDVPAEGLDATVGGWLARTTPGRWFRNLAVGRSHGLMVALVAYAHASGEDLARGRTIAGTGSIAGNGSVGTIGGLRAKATAARRIGADNLLFPAEQVSQLHGFGPGTTLLVPVSTLDDAIEALTRNPDLVAFHAPPS